MNFQKAIGLLIVFVAVHFAQAQEKEAIAILTKSKADGVWLRWAPTDPTFWQLGNQYGYTIERFTLLDNGELEEGSQAMLTHAPIKPYSPSQIEQLAATIDEVAVLEELLYGEGAAPSFSPDDIATVLTKSNELDNRFGIAMLMCDLSTIAAKAAGLFWKDTDVKIGSRYIYRIKIAYESTSFPISPGVSVIRVTEEMPLLSINDVEAQFEDRSVTLSWSTLLHKGVYSAYYIEKSSDGKNYNRISDLPYVHMSEALESETAYFVDSLEANNQTYYYRISGISPFAEIGPYSNIVSGEGKDDLFGLLVIREIKALESESVSLSWDFPVEMEKQISGFIVSKSPTPNGPFIDVNNKALPATMRAYEDKTSYNNTYYILKAMDKNGQEVSRSFPYLVQFEDNTPPAIPETIEGTIDNNGIAKIRWKPNSDHDLLGYRVFRSNSLHEEFVEVTKDILNDSYFEDSINIKVLNKKVYYNVVAVDKNFNTSDYSSALELSRPDVIPPTPPVFTNTTIKSDSLILGWVNSVSDDVAKYELTRIERNGRAKKLIMSWYPNAPKTELIEASLIPGNDYQYIITVYDSAGNESEAISRKIHFETGYRKALSTIQTKVDREAKQITLQWKSEPPVVRYIVYRKTNDGSLTLYQTLDGNVDTFVDSNVSINNMYEYKIQQVFPQGVRSTMSEGIKVKY